jgi:hypothetical protein
MSAFTVLTADALRDAARRRGWIAAAVASAIGGTRDRALWQLRSRRDAAGRDDVGRMGTSSASSARSSASR